MALPGTLALPDADVDQGTVLGFAYAVAADHVSDSNWVGIWPDPGDGPVNGVYVGGQTTYVYAPGASGTAVLSSGALPAGSYLAFYLYDDGYTSLAPPVAFTVRNTPQLPAPAYRGEFGRHPRELGNPAGMTVDARGRFWVADPATRSVHTFSRRGRRLGAFGRDVLRDPQDVAVGAGRVFVADAARSTVEEFTGSGRHVRSLGAGELVRPRGIEIDQQQRLLVSDVGNNRVARFDVRSGRLVSAFSTGVHIPHGISVDGERTWVVSSSRQWDGNPGVTCFVDDQPTITLGYGQHSVFGGLSNPAHVAVDRQGHVLVSVPDFGWVARFQPTGAFVGEFGTSGRALLRHPQGVVIGSDGDIYVADTGGGRVVRFSGTATEGGR
jgi:hypothetical protein